MTIYEQALAFIPDGATVGLGSGRASMGEFWGGLYYWGCNLA